MGNLIAALGVLVTAVGAAWVIYQDAGRDKRLAYFAAILPAAEPGSLEADALRSVFNQLALPIALEQLAPPRRKLRLSGWVLFGLGGLVGGVWIVLVITQAASSAAWTSYSIALVLLFAGTSAEEPGSKKRLAGCGQRWSAAASNFWDTARAMTRSGRGPVLRILCPLPIPCLSNRRAIRLPMERALRIFRLSH